MKRVAAIFVLLALTGPWLPAARGQSQGVLDYERESKVQYKKQQKAAGKAAKKQLKLINKASKKQAKAYKKSLKEQQKHALK